MGRIGLSAALVCAAWLAGCGGGGDDDGGDGGGEVSFSDDLAPVFVTKCNYCHQNPIIDVDFTRPFDPDVGIVGRTNSWFSQGSDQEFIVDPGNVDNSFILTKVTATDLDPEVEGVPMPLATPPVVGAELDAVEQWIADGAQDDAFFAGSVAPIFGTEVSLGATRGKCTFCHYPNSTTNTTNTTRLDVTSPFDSVFGLVDVSAAVGGTRVIPGDVDNSVLIQKLTGDPAVGAQMPFVPERMTDQEVANLRSWIAAGAQDN